MANALVVHNGYSGAIWLVLEPTNEPTIDGSTVTIMNQPLMDHHGSSEAACQPLILIPRENEKCLYKHV